MSAPTEELKHRVEARRKELEAELERKKADAHAAAGEDRRRIERKLEELNTLLRDGWSDLTDAVVGKLNRWLKG